MKLGLQIYTLREYLTTPDQIRETLGKAKAMGYAGIEWFGLMGHTPAELAEMTAEAGMEMFSLHRDIGDLVKCDTEELDAIAATGVKYLPIGWLPKDRLAGGAQFAETCALIRTYGKEAAKRGMLLMYHNHDQEFKKIGSQIVLEKLAQDVPVELMGFTLDTFWIQAGGGDPAQWVEKLSGRVPVIHLKDYAYGRKMAVVGEGNINFSRVFSAAEESGTKYLLVEQDDCNGEDPIECLRRSYEYLKACGFN